MESTPNPNMSPPIKLFELFAGGGGGTLEGISNPRMLKGSSFAGLEGGGFASKLKPPSPLSKDPEEVSGALVSAGLLMALKMSSSSSIKLLTFLGCSGLGSATGCRAGSGAFVSVYFFGTLTSLVS